MGKWAGEVVFGGSKFEGKIKMLIARVERDDPIYNASAVPRRAVCRGEKSRCGFVVPSRVSTFRHTLRARFIISDV